MTRREQLLFCKVCELSTFHPQKGMVCKLTQQHATFTEECARLKVKPGMQAPIRRPIAQTDDKKSYRHTKRGPFWFPAQDWLLLLASLLLSVFIYFLSQYALQYNERFSFTILFIPLYLILSTWTLSVKSYRKGDGNFVRYNFLFITFHALVLATANYFSDQASAETSLASIIPLSIVYFILGFPGFGLSFLFSKIVKRTPRRTVLLSLSGISTGLLATVLGLHFALFIPAEKVIFDEAHPMSYEQFRGIPNIFTSYAGVISSTVDYEIYAPDSARIYAYANSEQSWIKKKHYSAYILEHERYHFKISELLARKFRHEIISTTPQKFEEGHFELVKNTSLAQLNIMQDQYDLDADHGIIIERQMEWDFLIDSLLLEYSATSDPLMVLLSAPPKKGYFRYMKKNGQGNPVFTYFLPDSLTQKISCYYVERDDQHRPVYISHIENGEPAPAERWGIINMRIEYGQNTQTRYNLDAKGRPTTDSMGVSIYRITYHYAENLVSCEHLNSAGNPINDVDGISKILYQVNPLGQCISSLFFDKYNRQTTHDGWAYGYNYSYDKKDHIIQTEGLDRYGQPASSPSGIASNHYSYDPMRNISRVKFTDIDGKPAMDKHGVHSYKYIHDEYGFIACEARYNASGNLILNEQGIAFTINRYNEKGFPLETASYGANRNLIIDDEGFGKVKWEYTPDDRIASISNFDAYHEPWDCSRGYARIEYGYDSLNPNVYLARKFIVDSVDYTRIISGEIAKCTEEDGLLTEYAILNENLEPVNDPLGVSTYHYKYDKFGRYIQREQRNKDGKLVEDSEGVAQEQIKYDARGNVAEKIYYDADLTLRSDTLFARLTTSYNSENQLVSVKYYNANNQLTIGTDGYAEVRHSYARGGKESTSSFFDSDGNPFYNENGQHTIHNFYNTEQKIVEKRILNKSGKLSEDASGVAIYRYTYKNGLLTSEQYFDNSGARVECEDGYAKLNLFYDRNHNIILQEILTENLLPAEDSDGLSFFSWEYNRNGTQTSYNEYSKGSISKVELLDKIFNQPPLYVPVFFNSVVSEQTNNDLLSSRKELPDGRREIRTTWHRNGTKATESVYINGRLEGTYLSWYESGQMESKIEYNNGVMHGYNITYYKNGRVESMHYYEYNRLINEKSKTWYATGDLRSEYIDGEYTEYDQRGNVIISSS